MVDLRPIDDTNREAVLALRVSPDQLEFVSSVEDSLREAAQEPDGRAIQWALYDDEAPVGFVMISDEVGGPGYIAHYLWKVLIDERHQAIVPPEVWGDGDPEGVRRRAAREMQETARAASRFGRRRPRPMPRPGAHGRSSWSKGRPEPARPGCWRCS